MKSIVTITTEFVGTSDVIVFEKELNDTFPAFNENGIQETIEFNNVWNHFKAALEALGYTMTIKE